MILPLLFIYIPYIQIHKKSNQIKIIIINNLYNKNKCIKTLLNSNILCNLNLNFKIKICNKIKKH